MKVAVLTSVLSIISLGVSAAPTVAKGGPLPVDLVKRGDNGASCNKRNQGGRDYVRVDTWGTWDNDWGRGFLDNLRGQCGWVMDWKFEYYDNGNKGSASFSISGGANAWCVENAIWLASSPTGAIGGVTCYLVQKQLAKGIVSTANTTATVSA
ncbi:hypothetical protein FRC17_007854 [Serendipita sp. 399]|nr:hypothetical protein FRC17_007854 [Serendipita sp. 399]